MDGVHTLLVDLICIGFDVDVDVDVETGTETGRGLFPLPVAEDFILLNLQLIFHQILGWQTGVSREIKGTHSIIFVYFKGFAFARRQLFLWLGSNRGTNLSRPTLEMVLFLTEPRYSSIVVLLLVVYC